jgi:hypothetical protein
MRVVPLWFAILIEILFQPEVPAVGFLPNVAVCMAPQPWQTKNITETDNVSGH